MRLLNFRVLDSITIKAENQEINLHNCVLIKYAFNVPDNIFSIFLDGCYYYELSEEVDGKELPVTTSSARTEINLIFKNIRFLRIQELPPTKKGLLGLMKENCLNSIEIITPETLKKKETQEQEYFSKNVLTEERAEGKAEEKYCQQESTVYQVGNLFTHDELDAIDASAFMQINFIYTGEILISAETVEVEVTTNFKVDPSF